MAVHFDSPRWVLAALSALLLAIVAPGGAFAQSGPLDSDAVQILEEAKARYLERVEGVDNYTLVQTVNGRKTAIYFERHMVDGMPTFVIVPPREYEGGGPAGALQSSGQSEMERFRGEMTGGAGPIPTLDAWTIDRLSPVARLVGNGSVDGFTCHLLVADVVGRVAHGGGAADGGEISLRRIHLWLDAEELVLRRSVLEADVSVGGFSGPVEIETEYSDYRQVENMYEPFRRVTKLHGLGHAAGGTSEEDRRTPEAGATRR